MDEAPKSALELAMERLKKKDADAGVEERSLSDEQKNEIAEVRRVYAARVAQEEILHKSGSTGVVDPQERAKREQDYRRDVQRMHDDRDRKIELIRNRA